MHSWGKMRDLLKGQPQESQDFNQFQRSQLTTTKNTVTNHNDLRLSTHNFAKALPSVSLGS